jgi:hypothetical protein
MLGGCNSMIPTTRLDRNMVSAGAKGDARSMK